MYSGTLHIKGKINAGDSYISKLPLCTIHCPYSYRTYYPTFVHFTISMLKYMHHSLYLYCSALQYAARWRGGKTAVTWLRMLPTVDYCTPIALHHPPQCNSLQYSLLPLVMAAKYTGLFCNSVFFRRGHFVDYVSASWTRAS